MRKHLTCLESGSIKKILFRVSIYLLIASGFALDSHSQVLNGKYCCNENMILGAFECIEFVDSTQFSYTSLYCEGMNYGGGNYKLTEDSLHLTFTNTKNKFVLNYLPTEKHLKTFLHIEIKGQAHQKMFNSYVILLYDTLISKRPLDAKVIEDGKGAASIETTYYNKAELVFEHRYKIPIKKSEHAFAKLYISDYQGWHYKDLNTVSFAIKQLTDVSFEAKNYQDQHYRYFSNGKISERESKFQRFYKNTRVKLENFMGESEPTKNGTNE